MKVKAITPIRVSAIELRRRQERYDRLSPKGCEVDLVNLPERSDTPTSISAPEDVTASETLIAAEARQTLNGAYDFWMPDAILDLGLSEATDLPSPHGVGMMRLSVGFLDSIRIPFVAVFRNEVLAREFQDRLSADGLGHYLEEVRVMNLDFQDVASGSRWNTALEEVARTTNNLSVACVLNGCSAVDVLSRSVDGIRLMDPCELALNLLTAWGVSN